MKQSPARKTATRRRVAMLASGLLTFCAPVAAQTSADTVFALSNHNPFLQVFGLPTFQSATLTLRDAPVVAIGLDLANNADFGETDSEKFLIDGESYFLTVSFRRRVSDWLEIGADLPLVAHDDGFMDGGIRNWHDIFGMSNTKRRGEDDKLQFVYERDGETLYGLSSSASGIGDIQLTAAIPLREQQRDGYALTIRSSLKLPTGDETKLLGSGAADIAAGLYASGRRSMFGRVLGVSGFAGAMLLGDGDVLPGQQRNAVPFGGAAASWWFAERLALVAQVQAQGAYFDSDIEELGGSTIQLDVGLAYRPKSWRSCLNFAVIEDIQADATTDFGLHFSVDARCGTP